MVLDRLLQRFAPEARKASQVARVVTWSGQTSGVWGSRDTTSLTRTGFVGNPVGFRAVRLIAEAVAALPLVLEGLGQRFETHPVLDLLTCPNADMSGPDFVEALIGHLLLAGNAYVEAVAGEVGCPAELHLLRPDRMRVVPGPEGWPEAYLYQVDGRKHRFPNDPARPTICHVRAFHPLDDHYGLAPLQAAASALEVHDAASRWAKALLENAARPSGALVWSGQEGQGSLSDDQFRRLSDEISENFQGARNAGRPMVLEGGLDWKPMGFSPSEMEFQKTKEAAAREIALAFGVPPMLLGLPGDATYANYQEANRAFYRLTVVPLAARVAARLAQWMSLYCSENLTLKPDLDQVPALASEREAQWRRITAADFLDPEEKRRLLGLPPRQRAVTDD